MSVEKKGKLDVNLPYIPFSKSYKHPGMLVETKSLQYAKTFLPSYTIKNEKVTTYLSDAQLDVVAMACESFQKILPSGQRQGFFLGDGAGVGKNRSICGLIAETLYCQSRVRAEKLYAPKALIITCSNAMFEQTQSDLMEMEVDEPLFVLGSRSEGVELGKRRGILYATYSLLITPGTRSISRLDQIVEWLGPNFEGLIVFDECHSAKRYAETPKKSTATGDRVVELQSIYPLARILYSSATGLSTIGNVGYLQRLGLYGQGTPYDNCTEFIEKSELRGVSAMELLVAELRAKGVFIARTLSMEGIVFERLECSIEAALYNESTLIWALLYQFIKAIKKVDGIKISRFWQAHQRYFAALILSCKIDPVVQRVQLELQQNKAIVIGLQSTGEARLRASVTKNNMTEEDRFCAAKEILVEVLEKIAEIHLEEYEIAINASKLKKIKKPHDEGEDALLEWVDKEWQFLPPLNTVKKIKKPYALEHYNTGENLLLETGVERSRNSFTRMLRKKIIKKYCIIAEMFALNPIDDFVEKLGGDGVVAELTGRSLKRELTTEFSYENCSRNSQLENMRDYTRFMEGEKKIAIISEAFSTGVSLHNKLSDDPSVGGDRVHITVEFSWSPDRVIQQFGRTHRSNQRQPPMYLLVVSNVPGEERFLASITEKLKVMGALTRADQCASGYATHISNICFDEATWKYGIEDYIKYLQTTANEVARDKLTLQVLQLVDVVRHSKKKYSVTTVAKVPTKFLNRLMGIPIIMQQWVLDGITNSIDEQRRNSNSSDCGIKDLELGPGVLARITEKKTLNLKDGQIVTLNRIEIDKSLPLALARNLIKRRADCEFVNTSTGPAIIFRKLDGNFLVYRPHDCVASTLYGFEKRCLKPIPLALLEKWWKRQVRAMVNSPGECAHHYLHGKCEKTDCSKKDMAKYSVYVLTGPLTMVWDDVRKAVFGVYTKTSYLNAVRVTATNEAKQTEKLIGVTIPEWNLPSLYKKFNFQSDV